VFRSAARAQVGRSAVGEAEPQAVVGDVPRASTEGQHPVTFLAPRRARRVERVRAVARRDPDGRGGAGAGIGERLYGRIHVPLQLRRGEEVPEPVLAVAVVGQGLEVEAVLVPGAAAEVVEPAAGLGPRVPVAVPLDVARVGPGANGFRARVEDDGVPVPVHADDLLHAAAQREELPASGAVEAHQRVR